MRNTTKQRIADVIYMLENEKMSLKEMASHFGMTYTYFRKFVSNHKLGKYVKFNQALGKSSRYWNDMVKCSYCGGVGLKYRKTSMCSTCGSKRLDRWEKDGMYYVYYLPEEHYIGVTNHVKRRMQSHRSNQGGGRKITDGMEVIYSTPDPTFAALLEAMLHNIGYHGSQYQRNIHGRK